MLNAALMGPQGTSLEEGVYNSCATCATAGPAQLYNAVS